MVRKIVIWKMEIIPEDPVADELIRLGYATADEGYLVLTDKANMDTTQYRYKGSVCFNLRRINLGL